MSKRTRKLVLLDVDTLTTEEQANAKFIKSRVVGQDRAQEIATEAIARAENPLRDMTRPIGVYYLIGKSRTGKTLIVETVAEILHGAPTRMVKVNCGAYKREHQVTQIIGAPPSYVGYKDPSKRRKQQGPDTSAKLSRENLVASRGDSKRPITVVLLDEANLLHEDFDDILMSISDKGELDLGNNDVVDFRDCIIFMTSNLGMREVEKLSKPPMGFRQSDEMPEVTEADVKAVVDKALTDRYRPEWLNRLDEIVIFAPLTNDMVGKVVDMEIEKFQERMDRQLPRGQRFKLEVEKSAKDFLLAQALKNKGNVANLKRALSRHLADPLGRLLKKNEIGNGDVIVVQCRKGAEKLSFFVAEGETFEVPADNMVVAGGDTVETQAGLAKQRRIARAAQEVEEHDVDELPKFEVVLQATSEKGLMRAGTAVSHDLREVYGVKIVSFSYTCESPWMFVAVVRSTEQQMDVFAADWDEVTVRPYRGDDE